MRGARSWLGMQARSATWRWNTRWLALRDRWLADARFRRRAARFLPTRWIARRRAAAVFDLAAGFVYSQVLAACMQLRLFELLAHGPLPLHELARHVALDRTAAQRLLDAAAALRLIERRADQVYGLGPLGGALVGNEAIAAMVEHHRTLYSDLADPVGLLRAGRGASALARLWPYARSPAPGDLSARQVADYSALMTLSQSLVADEVLDAYDFGRHRRLLDVGGGEGTFAERAALRSPRLHCTVFDLPAVAQRACSRLARSTIGPRLEVVAGDFFADPLPGGADLATLLRVVHDHDDDAVLELLRKVRAALIPGGTLLLAEPMADTAGAQAMGDAYFGMYLYAMGQGRPRSRHELTRLLREAGFERVRALATGQPLQTGLLRARVPDSA